MAEYIFAKDEHRERIIDFINMVFSQAHEPHEFRTLIPKVYGEGSGHADIHAIALEDERVRGCVAMYEFPVKIADETLKVGYIGSVSAHIQDHGAGHMKQLMKIQLKAAEDKGLDFITLGGQRQRYAYFGFEPAGISYEYNIGTPNICHALKDIDPDGISFDEMKPEDAVFCYDLFEKLPLHGTRTPENFVITCRTWRMDPYVIRKNGETIGYLVTDDEKEYFNEFLLVDYADTKKVIKAWVQAFNAKKVGLNIAPYMPELNKEIGTFAEGVSIHANGCLNILNPAKVIRAYMKLKQEVEGSFTDGKAVIKIGDKPNVKIEVKNGVLTVDTTDEDADACLTGYEAVKLIFGINRFDTPNIAKKLPKDWFPLPMFLMGSDHF